MPKLRVIIKPPPEPQGEPEQQVEALRDYLLQMSEELAYVLTHLEADNINDSTFERIQSMIPRPYTGLPVMDGDASSGQSEQWARGDHRHGHDSSKADVTALATETAAREAHEADTGNPHSVTAAQVGLGNVANERQYSAQNPPPIPTPGEVGAIPATEKGSAGGVAELDSNGMVPSAQLPSYVDDVLEYASLSAFPVTGESGKIYVAQDTNKTYRWSGSAYVEISESLALGETSATAYRGDRGKAAYDHSQITSGNPHNVTAAEVGARPDTWTPSASDVGAQPTITASGMLKGDGLGGVSVATAGTDYQAPLTAGTDYQTPLVAGTDYATPAMIPTVPDPSDATPQDLGTADAGVSDDYSRADHVHNIPSIYDMSYTNADLSATNAGDALDEIVAGGGGGGPSPATAVPVMDGTGAVGVSLLYAREDHEHPSDTGKQDAITANGILMGDGQGGVSAAVAGTDYASASAVASLNERYTNNTTWRMNTDANDYKTSGMYAMATGNANVPAPWGILFVQGAISDTIEQEYRREGYIWNREFRNNTWSSWKDTTPNSELIGSGHTLIRCGKLRILKIGSFYLNVAPITIPVADRPTSTTSGLATYYNSNSASMTVGFVTINTDGSIVYQSWSGYNSGASLSNVTGRWVVCPGVIWMTA